MKVSELKKILKDNKIDEAIFKGKCHDCGKDVEVIAGIEDDKMYASGGAVYKVDKQPEHDTFLKCDECFKKDKTLRNFRATEVYSRIVGYIRPVQSWNLGKKEEFKNRKEFEVKDECK